MKLWRRCKKCRYQNYIEFKDEKVFWFTCERCGEKTQTAKHLSRLSQLKGGDT